MTQKSKKDIGIYDTNYSNVVHHGGYPRIRRDKIKSQRSSFIDIIAGFFFQTKKNNDVYREKHDHELLQNKSLEDQIKYIVSLDDKSYSDKLLTPELRKYILMFEKDYIKTLQDQKSHIAPSYREIKRNKIYISGTIGKIYYAHSYPSYIDFLRTRDILHFYAKRDLSRFLYPADDGLIKAMLKRRATQLKAEISNAIQKGITYDMDVNIEYKDVENIRQKLATREERYFEAGFYTAIYAQDEEKLQEICKKREQKIGGYGIRIKSANQRMDEGHTSTLPLGIDQLGISRSMVTTSLAGSFPFISNDLIEKTGILYGINLHTGSLVIFDRFNHLLPNANSILLATSGAGKSFAVKLEILRYLMLGIDVIIIDPEREYEPLSNKVGGTYIDISVNSEQHINPFDLPPKIDDRSYDPGDLLRTQILNLIGLIKILVQGINPAEEALLDKALQASYALKEITFDDDMLVSGQSFPKMEDLMHVLEGMEGAENLALKLSKYVTGTFANLFNQETNIDLDNQLTVFSIRDTEDSLKTPAMFSVLNFIRTKIRAKKKKRLLVIDEARVMMQDDISANFLYQLVKRARKYGLGITTITQDVEDFLQSHHGKSIVSNSSLQILLKQSTSSIKTLEKTFGLSESEKQKLISSNIGEGILFAGNKHVALKILASPSEKQFITTDV